MRESLQSEVIGSIDQNGVQFFFEMAKKSFEKLCLSGLVSKNQNSTGFGRNPTETF